MKAFDKERDTIYVAAYVSKGIPFHTPRHFEYRPFSRMTSPVGRCDKDVLNSMGPDYQVVNLSVEKFEEALRYFKTRRPSSCKEFTA